MNILRELLDSSVPLVAVSFRDSDSQRLAREAKEAGVDVAELRIDRFSDTDADHVLSQIRMFQEMPILATVRSEQEGGSWSGTAQERLELFRAVAPAVQAVDIELSSQEILADVVDVARQHGTIVIVSHHDFDRTPQTEELEAVIADAKAAGADVVKISTMAESENDVRRLASLLLRTDDETQLIVIAMGSVGAASRVFFPALGSRLTYSFIGDSGAPGQLDFSETIHLLRRFNPGFDQRKALEGI